MVRKKMATRKKKLTSKSEKSNLLLENENLKLKLRLEKMKNKRLLKEEVGNGGEKLVELDEKSLTSYYNQLDPKGETTLEDIILELSDHNGRIGWNFGEDELYDADDLLGNHGAETETLYKSGGEDVTFSYSNTGAMDAMTIIIAPNEDVFIGTYSDAREVFEQPKNDFIAEYENMQYHTYEDEESGDIMEVGYDSETDTMYMGGATNTGVFREYEIDVDYDGDLDYHLEGIIEEYQSSKY